MGQNFKKIIFVILPKNNDSKFRKNYRAPEMSFWGPENGRFSEIPKLQKIVTFFLEILKLIHENPGCLFTVLNRLQFFWGRKLKKVVMVVVVRYSQY